jgi:hypothetical protein
MNCAQLVRIFAYNSNEVLTVKYCSVVLGTEAYSLSLADYRQCSVSTEQSDNFSGSAHSVISVAKYC